MARTFCRALLSGGKTGVASIALMWPGLINAPIVLYTQDNMDPLVTSVSARVITIGMRALALLDRLFGPDRVLTGDNDRYS